MNNSRDKWESPIFSPAVKTVDSENKKQKTNIFSAAVGDVSKSH